MTNDITTSEQVKWLGCTDNEWTGHVLKMNWMDVSVLKCEDEMDVETSPKRCVGDNPKQLADRNALGVHNETPLQQTQRQTKSSSTVRSRSRRIGRIHFDTNVTRFVRYGWGFVTFDTHHWKRQMPLVMEFINRITFYELGCCPGCDKTSLSTLNEFLKGRL